VLDSRLEKEAEWNHFFEYQTLSSCIGITSVGSEIFPSVDQKISEFLTPHILSAEHTEMAQCLYYDATLVDLTTMHLNNDNEDKTMDDKFIEDIYDAKQALLKLLITKVGQENIQEIWLLTDKRPGNNRRKHFIIVMDPVSYLCTCMSNVSRASHWYCDSKKEVTDNFNMIFVNKQAVHVQQSKIIQIVPQPLTIPCSLAVECNDSEKVQWLKTFIDQKKCLLTSNNKDKMINKSDIDTDNNAKKNIEITNPPITKHKSRLANKRYKSTIEKAHRQPYSCRTCGLTGHNSAKM
ncbi:7533_t:CDS:2, partial [Cetraspora pellucida]